MVKPAGEQKTLHRDGRYGGERTHIDGTQYGEGGMDLDVRVVP